MLSDMTFLNIAREIAAHSTCSRLHVGGVLVRDNRAFAHGYNGAPSGEAHCVHTADEPCKVSVHAEVNTLVSAARLGVSTMGSMLYLTHSPCYSCAGLIINAGIEDVIYGEKYRDLSGVYRLHDREVGAYYGRKPTE